MREMQALPKFPASVFECPHSEQIVGMRGIQFDTRKASLPIPRSVHSLSGVALAGCGQWIEYHQVTHAGPCGEREQVASFVCDPLTGYRTRPISLRKHPVN